MLIDKKLFDEIERSLRENGELPAFESESGEVLGRMMITTGTLPEELAAEAKLDEKTVVFECSFDFCDVVFGVAVDIKTLKVVVPLWTMYQTDDVEEPAREWSTFFIKTLFRYISFDGTYRVPVCTFINNEATYSYAPEKE